MNQVLRSLLMTASILFHPLATFVAGLLAALVALVFLLISCTPRNTSEADVAFYRDKMGKTPRMELAEGSAEEKAALERFKAFLQGIGNVSFVQENTRKVYAADAYLDDTLLRHDGAAAIEEYFVKTSQTMTSYHVAIDDVARSGSDYYVRWSMVFAAPALRGGKPVHSVGVSQIRFNAEGKVAFHQDFWDSGKNFYAHLPMVGGAVGIVRGRLNAH